MSIENRQQLRLAGLSVDLVGVPYGFRLPPEWSTFSKASTEESPALTMAWHSCSCPHVSSGLPINDSPYFHLFPRNDGYLGVPISESGWKVAYDPVRERLDIYAEQVSEPGLVIDRVLWRFRSFILARRERLVFHAMGAVKNDRAILFAGDSGSGKSTLARILHQNGWSILSDESPIVEKMAVSLYRLWGSPWPSSGGFAENGSGLLKAIVFLEHAPENELERITPGQAVHRLMGARLALCPMYETGTRERLLGLLDRLLADVPSFDLKFLPDQSVAALLERMLCAN